MYALNLIIKKIPKIKSKKKYLKSAFYRLFNTCNFYYHFYPLYIKFSKEIGHLEINPTTKIILLFI